METVCMRFCGKNDSHSNPIVLIEVLLCLMDNYKYLGYRISKYVLSVSMKYGVPNVKLAI